MAWNCVYLLAGCLLLTSATAQLHNSYFHLLARNQARRHPHGLTFAPQPCNQVKWYEQKLDHFNAAELRTFKQRYLVNQDKWDKTGPILLYTGNEGDIVWFCQNTLVRSKLRVYRSVDNDFPIRLHLTTCVGFIFDLSAKLNALVVFIEHRYYGESLPFGNASYQDKEHLGYLTSAQALADFALLITDVKESVFKTESPVIALGGSYGGMLSAWIRMKYPNVIVGSEVLQLLPWLLARAWGDVYDLRVPGSLAASAPLWWFTGLTPCNSASVTITRDFEQATPGWPHSTHLCSDTIRNSWKAFKSVGGEAGGLKWLSSTFNLCHTLANSSSLEGLMSWVEGTWFNMAMADYPYPAAFLEPMPAWPINKTCQFLSKQFDSDKELLQALASSLSVYYNYTGQSKCYNLGLDATADLGELGWSFQACTEMVMPMCSDGLKDMFRPNPWDLKKYEEGCKKSYGVTPQPYLVEVLYGGKNISSHSNIIFSNGLLDPWHGGGVLSNISDSLVALKISNGAHHLDLRSAHEDDPKEVTSVREREVAVIKEWIKEYHQRK